MVKAWLQCRKNKRNTAESVKFEMNAMDEIASLTEQINARTYKIGRSNCFVVTSPRLREVFAANFRDRVPHHYVAMKLEPLFEKHLNEKTFNCRKGKGQLYGIECLKRDMFECSKGYTEDCWVMKVDIKGFFMSIDKAIMAKEIDDFILQHYSGNDIEDLRWLCRMFVMHEPQHDCVRKSPMRLWDKLPKHKSLFTCPKGKGLPIGNLYTQLFANWHLTYLDEQIECDFGDYHGRYVDDIYIMSSDKQRLLDYVPCIRRMLAEKGLKLNERKFYIQHYTKGVEFTGAIVKPCRTYTRHKVIDGLRGAVKKMSRICRAADCDGYHFIEAINSAADSINSYLGIAAKHNDFEKAEHIVLQLEKPFYRFGQVCERGRRSRGSPIKVRLKRRFTLQGWTDEQIREIIKHKKKQIWQNTLSKTRTVMSSRRRARATRKRSTMGTLWLS